jgi:hypothetical protein
VLDSSAHGDFHFFKLGLVNKFVEVAPVARLGHLRVCGRKKSPEEVPLLLNFGRIVTFDDVHNLPKYKSGLQFRQKPTLK